MKRTAADWLFLDGDLLRAAGAKVSASDAGLLHGRGLFETFRARRGRVYRLDAHFQRLQAGAHLLGIRLPLTEDDLRDAVAALAERCAAADARVRLTVTAGPPGGRPAWVLNLSPDTGYPPELYEGGASALVSAVRRNQTSPLCTVKSLGSLDNTLARESARRSGATEALLLNTAGHLAEGAGTNVFIVSPDGTLLTPPLEDGALPGITRAAVLDLAAQAGIPAREASITLDGLLHAREAFLTNAVAGVLPLVRMDGKELGSGRPGEVTLGLRRMYEEAARLSRPPASERKVR